LEHHVPITPQTTFRIASVTKQFTAAAILKLQEEGKLSVEDKLSKYIPDFPRGDEVTLRHLLTHTSGIREYLSNQPDIATTTEAIFDKIKKCGYDFDPGAKWSYSNSGYVLLGYILAKVSGQSYGDFLRESFFQPLGMTNTGIYYTHLDLPHEAIGYSLETNGFKRPNWPGADNQPSWVGGDGVLYSTVEDLYRWNEGIFNGKVLGTASLKAAFTPVETKENHAHYHPKGPGYGFGWEINLYRGLRGVSHSGSIPGFSSYLLRLTDEKFTLTVLANSQPGRPNAYSSETLRQLVEIFLADKLVPLPVVNTNVSPESYGALTGRYELAGKIMIISRRGTHLISQYSGQTEFEIFPKSNTEFFLKAFDAQITFVMDKSGKAVKFITHQGGDDLEATRLKDIEVDPAVYDSLAGKYDYGHGVVLTVTREGSHLFAQLTGQQKWEIFPKSETEYFWMVVDAQITFVRDANGKVTKAIRLRNGQTLEAPKIP
jgi:CubicO group peptidase (beta-lactamase class C family)